MSKTYTDEVYMKKNNYLKSGFTIGIDEQGNKYIRCFECGNKSYNQGDIENKYCICCKKFHHPGLEFSKVNLYKQSIELPILDYKFLVSQNQELLKQNRELQKLYRGKSRSNDIINSLGMCILCYYCDKKGAIDEQYG